jgi:hypothetical protein
VNSPQTSTNLRLAVHGPWSAPPTGFQNTQLLRSWFEYDSFENDSEVSKIGPRPGLNWQLIFGILLVLGMSLGFWAGAAWLAARFWR